MQAMTHTEAIEQPTDRSRASSTTMRAIAQHAYGSTETLELTEVARPAIEADQVLVEVHAAGVDRGVWHLMTGLPYVVRLMGYGLTRPKVETPGADVAGRVVEVGPGVERFNVGDEVFGIASGAYAEFALADADKLAHKPASISFEQAAVASISGITALQALTEVTQVQSGQDVLVIGASGGVGSYAVQIAKALGARVTGVASEAKAELVRSLGADAAIDYRAGDYLDGSQQYDVIIDIGGRNPLRRLRKALTRTGTLVIVGGEGGDRLTGGVWRQVVAPLMSVFVPQRLTTFVSTEHFRYIEALAGYIERGAVTPAVGRTYRLDEVATAIEDLVSGHAQGKSAIVVR
jgi:NADPH:quinone reductase-like Zn-dependent oxidoreductase